MERYFKLIKNSKLLGGSFVVALGSLVVGALNYLFHLAIGRMVDVETYGKVISIISVFQLISFPAGLLGIIATWYAAKDKADENFHQAYEKLKVFSKKLFEYGIPILIIFILATPWLDSFLKIENHWALNLIWLAAFFSIFFGWAGGIMNGLQKFKELSIANILGALAKLAIGLFLVEIGVAVSGVSFALLFGAIFSFATIFIVIRHLAKKTDRSEIKNNVEEKKVNLRRYVLFAFFGFFLFNILSSTDMILAKHNLSAEEAGYYGALLVAARIIIFISGAIATVFFSLSLEENHNKKTDDGLFWKSIGITLIFCLVASLFYFLFPKFVLRLFFGQVYLSQAGNLVWFALMASSFSLANVVFFHFISKELFRELLAVSIVPIAEVAFIFIFGHNMTSIVFIAIIAQLIFFLAGTGFALINRQRRGQNLWIKN